MGLTESRRARLSDVAQRRQLDFTVVLENVHDPHNISAVLRSCESVGIPEVYVLYTEEHLDVEHLQMGKRSSAGARKWVDVHYFEELDPLLVHLRPRYKHLIGAYLDPGAQSLHDLDLVGPVALVFGNERDGLSNEMLSALDGTFFIPQMGLIQSLNISVACAVSIYEGLRQRVLAGKYDMEMSDSKKAVRDDYIERHLSGYDGDLVIDHSGKEGSTENS
jgi:tRNA (guanosine-2'-O-)-methyltransferase